MKKFTFFSVLMMLAIVFAPVANAASLAQTLSGKILLQVEEHGEAWYVYPGDFHRYYLGRPADAYNVMSNLSLGVSNDDFLKIASTTPDRFRGLILIKPEDDGRVYYVNPTDKSLVYMA